MIKHLLTLFIALTLFTGKAMADKPSISFVVPYKVVCEKQPDGTKQIRVKVALRKAAHAFVVDSTTGNINTDNTVSDDTTLLQATAPCRNLSGELALTNKLYGFDAELIGNDGEASYQTGNESSIKVDLCAFLVNVNLCCGKTLEESLEGKVHLDNDETIAWVDLGNFDIKQGFASNQNLMLANAPYATDEMLRSKLFDPSQITILKTLYNLAVKNLHGLPCCFETFGLDEQNAQRILCDLVSKLNGCPTEFTGKGTWGSCGETQNVKLSGTITKPITIDVCGKKLCFSELLSVEDSQETSYSTTPGTQTAACFSEFFINYLSTLKGLEVNGFVFTPPVGSCGIPSELTFLIKGRSYVRNAITTTLTLNLLCVDPVNHIYAFGVRDFTSNLDVEGFTILGCRFKLEECPKCCK